MSTGPASTVFDESAFGFYTVNSTVSTSTQTLAIDPNSFNHQISVIPYGSDVAEVADFPSSGIVEIRFRPDGSTMYEKMTDTINMTSGIQTKTFTGIYDSLRLDPTVWDSTLCGFCVRYRGWR